MSKIQITLSAANMGPGSTEADFDAWASYVNDSVCAALDLDPARVEVDQFAFTGRGAEGEDVVSGASEEERETIRRWLSVDGWETFCAQGDAA